MVVTPITWFCIIVVCSRSVLTSSRPLFEIFFSYQHKLATTETDSRFRWKIVFTLILGYQDRSSRSSWTNLSKGSGMALIRILIGCLTDCAHFRTKLHSSCASTNSSAWNIYFWASAITIVNSELGRVFRRLAIKMTSVKSIVVIFVIASIVASARNVLAVEGKYLKIGGPEIS